MKVLKNQPLESVFKGKIVKLTDMGDIKEIMIIDKLSLDGFPVKKISKNEYMVVETGEVLEFKNHAENRSQDTNSLRKTFKTIREMINFNFGNSDGKKNKLAFTITYADNMTDTERLYRDFKNFILRLRYKYPDVEYMSIVEPQERGAWHCHILLKFMNTDKIYIPNKLINEMWGNGFVSVKAIRQDVDNLGAYLSAYLGDVPVDEDNYDQPNYLPIKIVEIKGKKKKFIKGGRLHLYPPGMNIYRSSSGIKKPTKEWLRYDEAMKKVGALTPTYATKIKILDDDGKEINSITYENYNSKRSNCKQYIMDKKRITKKVEKTSKVIEIINI